jgi:hypothetical protein
MDTEPPRVFYRLVRTDPPTVQDFMSNEALGRKPKRPLSAFDRRCWRGVSHHDTREQAASAGGHSPWLGAFIATVVVAPGAPIEYEQTYRPGHWTLWGGPTDLLALVVSVSPLGAVH